MMNTSTMTWEEAVLWLRAQPDKQEFVRQCYYDDPLEAAADRFNRSEEWRGIRDLLGARLGGDVLEVGAGRGIVSYAFAKAGCRVTALEPDPSALVGSKAIETLVHITGVPITVVTNCGELLPFPEASFDIVFCRCVLHHARELRQMCREISRVLRSGGLFLAEREHVLDHKEDLPAFLAAHPLHHLYGGENAFLLREYYDAIGAAGLRLRRSIPPYHHVINFVPPMSLARLQWMTWDALRRRLPATLARWLSQREVIRQLYARTLSWRCRLPGRFYSFLAQKP